MEAQILQARMLIEQKRKALIDRANSKKQSTPKPKANPKKSILIAEAEEEPITIKRIDTNIIDAVKNELVASKKPECDIEPIPDHKEELSKVVYRVSENRKGIITIGTLQEDAKVEANLLDGIEDVPIVDVIVQEEATGINEIRIEEAREVVERECSEESKCIVEECKAEEVQKIEADLDESNRVDLHEPKQLKVIAAH